jgi:hypothetical protein
MITQIDESAEREARIRKDEEFFMRLRAMGDADLAARLERGGTIFAPNPHYVLEAARRLRCIEDRIRNTVDAVLGRRRMETELKGG